MLRIVLLGTLLAVPACEPEVKAGPIDRARYVEVYVELLRATDAAPDSAAAADSVRAILERRGVSEEDLLEFARRRASDPQYLADVWLDIENRLRSRPDTAKER